MKIITCFFQLEWQKVSVECKSQRFSDYTMSLTGHAELRFQSQLDEVDQEWKVGHQTDRHSFLNHQHSNVLGWLERVRYNQLVIESLLSPDIMSYFKYGVISDCYCNRDKLLIEPYSGSSWCDVFAQPSN